MLKEVVESTWDNGQYNFCTSYSHHTEKCKNTGKTKKKKKLNFSCLPYSTKHDSLTLMYIELNRISANKCLKLFLLKVPMSD